MTPVRSTGVKTNIDADALLMLFGAAMFAGGVVTVLAGADVGVLVSLAGGALALFAAADIYRLVIGQAPPQEKQEPTDDEFSADFLSELDALIAEDIPQDVAVEQCCKKYFPASSKVLDARRRKGIE